MISMPLAQAARVTGAVFSGDGIKFHGCSTDSRNIHPGELFIAIRGERFDGHDFTETAQARGAVAALVQKQVSVELPQLVVNDTRVAMGKLAQHWRSEFRIPLVAVTGSNGKTTVKEMLTSILQIKAPVLATRGNLNNDIGVPLTLFGLGNEHAYAVIEMGANHHGEIAWLTRIARPTVAVITQCAPAHLEGFGSVEGVARAKSEIYEGLDENGIAVINADDDYAQLWREKIGNQRHISFGLRAVADVTANRIMPASSGQNSFTLKTPAGSIQVELHLLGNHNVMNALAAASCAIALGIELHVIKEGLERMKPVKGRLETKTGLKGSRIIDDTYNANPVSLSAAIKALSVFPGRHWLVLGDMGELGSESEALHANAGRIAAECGIEKLYAFGSLSRIAVQSFGNGAQHFSSREELINHVSRELQDGITLLVKGSRSMQMELVVQALEMKQPC